MNQEPYTKPEVKPSKFASWERANLERLAEKLEQELLETRMDLQFALSNWRKAVKGTVK